MRIVGFPVPPFYENTWVVFNGEKAVIIDPGGDGSVLLDVLRGHRAEPEGVLLTHAHIDHVSGLPACMKDFPELPVWLHPGDEKLYKNVKIQAKLFSQPVPRLPKTLPISHNQVLKMAGLSIKTLHTPGHSPGSMCFLIEEKDELHLFTGDTLFYQSVGRSDLWGGDPNELLRSIRAVLFELPEHTICYPGHGPKTTIGHEKQYNPFL